jgi:hypothetical protein
LTPPSDFAGVLALLLATIAPYLVSGPLLSHAIEQLAFIQDKNVENWIKIAFAGAAALGAIFANSLLTGAYAGGATFGTYLASTLQQAGVLLGTMTFTNVAVSDFVPSFSKWISGVFANIVAAITKIIHPNAPVNTAAG